MPTAVLTYVPSTTMVHRLKREFITNNYGDGYYQTLTSEAAYSRANGVGSTGSYKGQNIFTINYNRAPSGSSQLANNLWTFFVTRLDAGNEPFYFYNPSEKVVPDPTGTETVGRYLVRLMDPNQVLSRELFRQCMFGFKGIDLIEVRV